MADLMLSPLPAMAALLLAICTGWCFVRIFGAPPTAGRYAAIDGMRGYLAFFVFLHHTVVWSVFLQTGQWMVPSMHLYAHFGQASVALFFMITGFLFFTKLLDARDGRPVDWMRLYVSRVLRLAPLYVLLILTTFLIVGVLSGWQLNVRLAALAKGMIRWMTFMIMDGGDLNGVEHTGHIGGGVAWSLAYEWFFYLSLPLMALFLGLKTPWPYLLVSLLAVTYALAVFRPEVHRTASFAGGLLAAWLVRSDGFRQLARGRAATLALVLCLVAAVVFYPTAYHWAPLVLLSIAFALIAGGNSLFGALTHAISRTLGELAYSIYLLHALLLFVLYNFVVGLDTVKGWSAQGHWLLSLALTPVLLCTCMATFRWVEQPAMRRATECTARLRAWLRLPPSASPGEIS